ncbi:MAG: RagB/SusD family nutrient uptake outer membrane protein [Bacteroidales bacterium]|nr:RagB/SusD family nutrient uptake outer membrane protein [Bacteroidales bacterium]
MKKTLQILIIALLAAGAVACESLKLGDGGLSEAPQTSGATLDTLFATVKDADKVLASAYYYLPYGIVTDDDNKMGSDILEAITDHYTSNKGTEGDGPNELYYNGALNANVSGNGAGGEAYRFGARRGSYKLAEPDYYNIRFAWFFLENADKIPTTAEDYDAALIARKKAEAKLCMAIAYANMVRYVGGVPILTHALSLEDELNFPRNTFKETIDYIVQLCDEAAPDLPWTVPAVENGRLTKAAALGLKLRILCFAASPTFNSDTPWHPDAANWDSMGKYVRYGEKYDATLWPKAKAAADEFMDALAAGGYYQLEQATPTGTDPLQPGVTITTPRDYRLAYRKGYFSRASKECLISVHKSNSSSYHNPHIKIQADYGSGATLDWVNKFPYKDGTPFPSDFDWSNLPKSDSDQQPFFKEVAAAVSTYKMGTTPVTETRDPRLYENVCVPGDLWNDGGQGKAYYNHWNHQNNCPGFLMMKYVLQESADRAEPPHWCLMRLAEVLLNAAEAYNEADGGPSAQAYGWIDAVRARVGLRPLEDFYPEGMTQEQFRNALILERELEFGFEEVRWFDMVRWGLKEAFTSKLHGLLSWGEKNRDANSFTYGNPQNGAAPVFEAQPPRAWYREFDTKWYLCPIPTSEIMKGYGMTQNPGW